MATYQFQVFFDKCIVIGVGCLILLSFGLWTVVERVGCAFGRVSGISGVGFDGTPSEILETQSQIDKIEIEGINEHPHIVSIVNKNCWLCRQNSLVFNNNFNLKSSNEPFYLKNNLNYRIKALNLLNIVTFPNFKII